MSSENLGRSSACVLINRDCFQFQSLGRNALENMRILVTGGMGYIGSHASVALLEAGHEIVIADNLSNSRMEIKHRIEKIAQRRVDLHLIDVTNQRALEPLFADYRFDGVMHFAGFKSVAESVRCPLKYYYNNLLSTICLANVCLKYGTKKIVFSSSATVYGDNPPPFRESMKSLHATNPYGETKIMSERILSDLVIANPDFSVSLLRYFNPIGAHESGLIGELPLGVPNNLMPFITRVAKGELNKLQIFGNDYPTADGTGIRDYIHVMDLVEGHVVALKGSLPGLQIYNLGTGTGISVLQLINAFEKVNEIAIPYEFVERRKGDVAVSYADASKAKNELKWTAKRDIFDMCHDAWQFEQTYNHHESPKNNF